VRFLAMAMFEQARHCSFGLTKTFFSRSSKSAFSRHDNVRASSTLLIWLNENVQKTCFGHFVKRIIFRTFAQVKLRSAKRKTVFSFQISCPRHHIANAQQ